MRRAYAWHEQETVCRPEMILHTHAALCLCVVCICVCVTLCEPARRARGSQDRCTVLRAQQRDLVRPRGVLCPSPPACPCSRSVHVGTLRAAERLPLPGLESAPRGVTAHPHRIGLLGIAVPRNYTRELSNIERPPEAALKVCFTSPGRRPAVIIIVTISFMESSGDRQEPPGVNNNERVPDHPTMHGARQQHCAASHLLLRG